MSILAVCPSRGRPAAAAETLASFLATRRDPRSRIVFVVDSDDPTAAEYPPKHTHVIPPGGNMGAALNAAAHDKDLLGDATSVGMVGDDNRFRTPGWDVTLDEWLTTSPGIAYGDDGFQHERLPTSWWVSRKIVDVFGLADRNLKHYYMDNFWLELGQGAGCLRYFPEISIEHLHPLAGKASDDATYQRGGSFAAHDRHYFALWRRSYRQREVNRLRSLLDSGRKRRILADWHHPALWESMSILFEDRFGWEIFSPIGIDWTRHGWKLEGGTPGWKAADYLVFPEAVEVEDHWERTEPEYPARPRKLVTWEQARAQRWDFVLASVAMHQRPFYELARSFRARLIHQIGNATHPIDRAIPQITLASAILPRAPRGVVVYHQEFDTSVFSYQPPSDPSKVTSMMLRLDTTSGPYRWLADAPGIEWEAFGGVAPGSDGYLAPMTKVADRLAAAGWVWHDKKMGDGFGHVVHNAAAMGRPLIGHASNYTGRLGEPLWKDLDTCIDLDRHSEADALRLIRAIAADPDWYRDVTERTAANFRAVVDFDADAEKVREALL